MTIDASNVVYCRSCGNASPAGAHYCHNCGQPMPLEMPGAQPATPTPVREHVRTGNGQRLAATGIDLGILISAMFAGAIVLGVFIGATENPNHPMSDAGQDDLIDWLLIVWLIGCVAYHLVLEVTRSATFGKSIVGLRTVTMDGEPVSPGRALGHQLARFVTVGTLGLGMLTVFFGTERRALHDLIAGTRSERV